MGSDRNLDRTIEQAHQDRFTRTALVAAGQQRDRHAGRCQHPADCIVVLTREDFGRSEQRRLRPSFNRDQHGFNCNRSFARADIALQQPQHWRRLGNVALDLGNRAGLGPGQRERQIESGAQLPIALQRCADMRAVRVLDQQQRQTVGEQFVVGQPVARGRVLAFVAQHQGIAPMRPVHLVREPRFDPFGQLGHGFERLADKCGGAALSQPFGQWIDRLGQLAQQRRAVGRNMVGMHDLEHLPVLVEPPRDPALLAQRQLLLAPARIAPEVSDRADIASRILRQHPQRPSARRSAIIDRGQRDHDIVADTRFIEIGHRAAFHEAVGQMIREILDPGQPEPLERARQRGADALEVVGGNKQGVKPLGTHHPS